VDGFKNAGITPFFVFNGIPSKRDRPFSTPDERPGKRDMAWERYGRNDKGAARELWKSSNSLSLQDYLSIVFEILTDNGVEFMRAPYSRFGKSV
jgi:hypothetical protein